MNGGPAQQFTQETIAEFQVLTNGYKAEFGQASGAIVNVITKSGGNAYRGIGSLFFRDDALDSSNSLDETRTDALPLSRYTYGASGGGPIVRDKVFFFGSAGHTSARTVNSISSIRIPAARWSTSCSAIRKRRSTSRRVRPRLERSSSSISSVGQHQLTQQVNYTDS